MTKHLFGEALSPSCATFALRETLKKGTARSSKTERSFYVDDLLLSTDSEVNAIQYAQELQEDLERGGFRLTKWMSNSKEVMAAIPLQRRSTRVREVDLARDKLPTDRALGVLWALEDDSLKIAVSPPNKPITKRDILSAMSSIFDPAEFRHPSL